MKNLALALVAVLGTTVFATAAPIQAKPATTPVKEVSMAKPAVHKHKKAKKEVVKVEAAKPEVKK
ncbi:MAG: hypothetical protein V4497_08770 [Bacteroidota bacterium]